MPDVAQELAVVREALVGALPEIDPRFRSLHGEAIVAVDDIETELERLQRIEKAAELFANEDHGYGCSAMSKENLREALAAEGADREAV
jgi:hypothetical protein